MKVMQEETFGPVLPIMVVPDEATALRLANETGFGLHGSVWSKDKRRAAAVASGLETGTLAVNDHMINPFVPNLQFGGIKNSGFGRELGPEGIRAFCYAKSVTSPRWIATSKMLGGWQWMPRRVGTRYWKTLARTLFPW
jgi:acyl-CoA reductase-like NAD-dependent aldehyde dehydrogenase